MPPSGPRPARASQSWLLFIVLAAIFAQTALNVVRPVLSYQLIELGADGGTIGMVTATYALLPLAAVMGLGRLAGRTRHLSLLMIAGTVTLAAAAAILAGANNVPVIVLAAVILGSGHVIFTIAGQAAIARYSPTHQLDRAFGWFTAAYSVGQLIGPALGGLLIAESSGTDRAENITSTLWLSCAVALIAVPLLFPMQRSSPEIPAISRDDQGATEPTGRPTAWKILKVPGITSHMAASMALLAMTDLLIAFLPLLGEEAGVGPTVVGLLLAVRAAASLLSRALLPWLSRHMSRSLLIIISLLGSALGIAPLPFVLESLPLALLFISCGGFCLGIGQPLTMSLVTIAVPAQWRSTALAVRLMGNRLGQVLVPLGAGLVVAPVGPAGAIWFASALLGASGVDKVLRTRKKKS